MKKSAAFAADFMFLTILMQPQWLLRSWVAKKSVASNAAAGPEATAASNATAKKVQTIAFIVSLLLAPQQGLPQRSGDQ